MPERTDHLRRLDKDHLWHPFTQMQAWRASDQDPLVIASGEGVQLTDTEGNTYLDGNSSIWTNLHGHGHPTINAAIRKQLDQIAHCSALGFSNEPAILLAEKLIGLFPQNTLTKVFFSDNGSTAIECACKIFERTKLLDAVTANLTQNFLTSQLIVSRNSLRRFQIT